MNNKLKKIILSPFSLLYKVNPVLEQKLLFRLKCGMKLDLDNPKTYNEKLAYMKLYYRNDLIPKLVDKYHAREYITENGYGDHLPKLYWDGFDAYQIPWNELPEKFVLKTTHGSGNIIICKDKSSVNRKAASEKLNKWLKEKYLPAYGEWFYGLVPPRIIVEEYVDDGTGNVPPDYKLFYFNGYPNNGCMGGVALTAYDSGRYVKHKRTLYDANWKVMSQANFGFETDINNLVEKPYCYEEMVKCANILAKPFPHARVDFFVVGEKFYVGEITFLNGAGYDPIQPYTLNVDMGSWIMY